MRLRTKAEIVRLIGQSCFWVDGKKEESSEEKDQPVGKRRKSNILLKNHMWEEGRA